MHFALELLASGLNLEGKAWEEYAYSPTMWDDDGVCRPKGANTSQLAGLKTLRDMKRSPSPIAAHFASQPALTSQAAADMTAAEKPKVEPEMKIAMEVMRRVTADCMSQRAKKPRVEPTILEPLETDATEEIKRTKSMKRKDQKREKKAAAKFAEAKDFEMALNS